MASRVFLNVVKDPLRPFGYTGMRGRSFASLKKTPGWGLEVTWENRS